MSYEIVISTTKKIETMLIEIGADGKGLHTKVSSIEHIFEERIVKSIRFLASIRNKLLHDDNFVLNKELLLSFKNSSDDVMKYLSQLKKEQTVSSSASSYLAAENAQRNYNDYVMRQRNKSVSIEVKKITSNSNKIFHIISNPYRFTLIFGVIISYLNIFTNQSPSIVLNGLFFAVGYTIFNEFINGTTILNTIKNMFFGIFYSVFIYIISFLIANMVFVAFIK